MKELLRQAAERRPVLAILVDSPDFNLRLAAGLKKLEIPVLLYISPQLWAWRKGRVRKVRRLAREVLCILPFETAFYHQHGVRARYVGHPLVDEVFTPEATIPQRTLCRGKLALLPGSRAMEVRALLPAMLEALPAIPSDLVAAAYLIMAPGMEGVFAEILGRFGSDDRLKVVEGEERRSALAACDLAWTASGTATLECALLGVPMIVGYRLKAISYLLARMLVDVPNVALVNLIAKNGFSRRFEKGGAGGLRIFGSAGLESRAGSVMGVSETNRTDLGVGMISLGCAKNLVDSELMLGRLKIEGMRITADAADADVVIVNTCGFIGDAKRESIEAILEAAQLRREGRLSRLIVAGCMVQTFAEELRREIPEIDAFVGLDELESILEAVRGRKTGHLPDQQGAVGLYDASNPRLISTGASAYLKIAEGCNNPCSFCSIPAMRGRFRSRQPEDVLNEARLLDRAGILEINLIAQDTTRYGEDLGLGRGALRSLIRRLLEETGIPWIRFLYAYPATLDEGLFELMATEDRFLSYLDIPLQHADRGVLKGMKRGGDAESFREMITRARSIVPDLSLRTTMIVGFPGEDEAAFRRLEEFVRKIKFHHLGVFAYSRQEENPGADLGDPIPNETKLERLDRLMTAQQEISLEHNQRLVGRKFPALVESPLPEMELLMAARLGGQAPEIDGRLLINDGDAPSGSLVEVEITEAHPYDVVGHSLGVLRKGPARLPLLGRT